MSETPQEMRWIVRFVRKRDGKRYFYRHDGCLTARMESSMLLDETTAKQLAAAITKLHPDFMATARKYPKKAGKPSIKSLRKAAADVMRGVETTVSYQFINQTEKPNEEGKREKDETGEHAPAGPR